MLTVYSISIVLVSGNQSQVVYLVLLRVAELVGAAAAAAAA